MTSPCHPSFPARRTFWLKPLNSSVPGVDNPYLLEDAPAAEQPATTRCRLPARTILWLALLAAVVIAAVVLAVQIHEQNTRIHRLQQDERAFGWEINQLVHRECGITCATNNGQPAP